MKTGKAILTILALTMCLLMAGCRGEAPYEKRLLAADSLMSVNAKSALQQLERIDNRALGSARDRAYHALLLTQARYKCYIPATSDSAINLALKYYRQHPVEREKLTRAHIYKGAVMEELGQYNPAMRHYKQALETAATDDYYNQGYIRYRIGRIYRDHLVADSMDITYFKDALRYFKQIHDSAYIFECLNDIGTSYYKNNRDSVQSYLDQALSLAHRLGDPALERRASINIAKTTMFGSQAEDIAKAKSTVLPLLDAETRTGYPPADLCDLLMTACYTLSRQNKTDSAMFFLNQLPEELPNHGYDSFKLLCLAEVARSRHDMDQFAHYSEKYRQLMESMLKDELQCQLRDIENQYDNATLKFKHERDKRMLTSWLLIALLVLSALAILLLLISHKASLRKRQLTDLEATIEHLQDDTDRLASQLAANKTMGDHLKETLKNQINTFGQLVEVYRKEYRDDPKKFSEAFKEAYSMNQPGASFWDGIQAYADQTHGGIVSRAIQENPSLSVRDIHFLSLCCLDLPATVIMACMGYNDVHALYNKKRRLAQSLKLKDRLDDYIKEQSTPAPNQA